MKRIQSDCQPNRNLLAWLNATLNCQQAQVEQLGNGLAYCLLMHHYFPVLVPLKKICLMPRRQSDNINNLRFLVQVLGTLKWKSIVFDINKVSSYSFHDNMQLLAKLHAALTKSEGMGNRPSNQSYGNSVTSSSKKIETPVPAKGSVSAFSLSSNTNKNSNPNGQQHHLQLIHLGLATPLKHPQKAQSNVLEQIKQIITSAQRSDRQKVKHLKSLLGIQVEQQNYQEEREKDLLSDENKKESTIVIDDL